MVRRIVLESKDRCPRCHLPLRWCVCPAETPVHTPVEIDILTHHREWHRPSSTGNLIARVVPESRRHFWRRERRLTVQEVRRPERDLWILHPHGLPPPSTAPDQVQVVLLDGSWSEASAMAQEVSGWGRLVSLPMAGASRYWLRAQQEGARFSTAEALMFLLESLGLGDAAATLRVQFELHVYASLRARGQKERADEFLRDSPIAKAAPEFLAALKTRRPREAPRA